MTSRTHLRIEPGALDQVLFRWYDWVYSGRRSTRYRRMQRGAENSCLQPAWSNIGLYRHDSEVGSRDRNKSYLLDGTGSDVRPQLERGKLEAVVPVRADELQGYRYAFLHRD